MGFSTVIGLLVTSAAIPLSIRPSLTVEAALKNATIDDEFGDELTNLKPQFFPSPGTRWEGEECAGCRVKPDPAFAFRNTYNAATYRFGEFPDPVGFSFQFTGTALYVFLTLAHNCCPEYITTLTEVNFTIDDGPPTFFRHTPDLSRQGYEYQFPAFTQEGLEHEAHTFTAKIDGPSYHIFLNFDYATYTYDDTLIGGVPSTTITSDDRTSFTSSLSQSPPILADPTTTPTNSGQLPSPTSPGSASGSANFIGPIAGGIIGALVLSSVAGFFFIRRRRRRRTHPLTQCTQTNNASNVTAFTIPSVPSDTSAGKQGQGLQDTAAPHRRKGDSPSRRSVQNLRMGEHGGKALIDAHLTGDAMGAPGRSRRHRARHARAQDQGLDANGRHSQERNRETSHSSIASGSRITTSTQPPEYEWVVGGGGQPADARSRRTTSTIQTPLPEYESGIGRVIVGNN